MDHKELSKLLDDLYAIENETGIKHKVGIINIDQKQVHFNDDKEWGIWHNYSKRGDCKLCLL